MEFGVMNPDKNERGRGSRGAHRLSGELMNISSLGMGFPKRGSVHMAARQQGGTQRAEGKNLPLSSGI